MILKDLPQCRSSLGFISILITGKMFRLIRVSNKDIQRKLGIRGKYAAFSDLVDLEGNGAYKIIR